MVVVRNLMVRAGADFSSLNKEMRKAQKNVSEFKSGVQGAVKGIGLALGAIQLGHLASDATRTAMDVEAAMQQINRLMGDNAHTFRDWSKETAGAFKMSEAAAIKYGAIYGNLLSTFSAGAEDTKDKTIDLLKASAVVASGTGRTMEDVMWRIRSGLLGNTEAIEDLGINVYVNMLKSTKAFQQFAGDKSWDQLDFQTQQLIRYYGILEQANKKFGAEVNINTNSALQGLQAALGNVKMALGQAFLPILNVILPILTVFVTWLYRVIQVWAMFTRALFGYKDPAKNLKNTAGAVGSVGGAYDGAAKAATGAGKAIGKAGKAAEKAGKQAKRGVAGFDEINELSDPSSDSGGAGAGAGGAGGGGGIGDIGGAGGLGDMPGFAPGDASAMEDVSKKVQELADKIRGFFKAVKDTIVSNKDIIIAALAGIAAGLTYALIATNWSAIVGGISAAFRGLAASIRAAWAAVTGPIGLAVAAVALLVGAFVYFYRTNDKFKGFVDGILLKIKQVALDLWNKVLVPFAKWLGDTLGGVWKKIEDPLKSLWNGTMKNMSKWLETGFKAAWQAVVDIATWLWKNVMIPLGAYLKTFYNDVLTPLGKVLKDVLSVAFGIVVDVAKMLWKDVLVPLGNFIKAAFGPTVDALSAVFMFLWEKVIKPLAKYLGDTFLKVFKDLTGIIQFLWYNVLKPLIPFLKTHLANAFESIKTVIGGLQKTFIGLMDFITGVFTGNWSKAWDGLKQIFKGVFESLWGIAKNPLNNIIDGVNRVISGLNSVKIDLPDWMPGGGKSFGLNIPKLPKLARGGIVNGATNMGNYIAGERGAEMIVPLENTSFTDKIASALGTAVMNAMNVAGGNNNDKEINIQIDGTSLARVINPYLSKEGSRVGGNLITAR